MEQARTRLSENGRLVIPAAFRQALGLKPGDRLVIRVEDDELRISSPRQALARARRLLRQHIPPGKDLTQSLIDDRRREAERE